VQAQAAQVETRSGTMKEVVDTKRIQELPLNGQKKVTFSFVLGPLASANQAVPLADFWRPSALRHSFRTVIFPSGRSVYVAVILPAQSR
jgi:hypothetical protein